MKVSVVIPLFNSEEFLQQTLASVAAQTHQDLELIVVDDGSTDDSALVAEREISRLGLKGQLIRRPESEPKGAGSCRNIGASSSSGEAIAFLDSDDIWLPEHVARAVTTLTAYGDRVGVYCAQGAVFTSDGETNGLIGTYGEGGVHDVWPDLLRAMFIPTQTLCIRRNEFEKTTGFSTALSCYEDWWLLLQLASRTMFFLDPQVGCLIRARADSLSRDLDAQHRVVMSGAMYRDQIRLYALAREEKLIPPEALTQLRAAIVARNQKNLSDHLCAGHFTEVGRISKALVAGRGQAVDVVLAIFRDAGVDALGRLGRRAGRPLSSSRRS